MITANKITIYEKFNGDIDGWARSGTKEQHEIINDGEWFLIDELVQDVRLIKNNLASSDFQKKIYKKLRENCDNLETIKYLEKIS